MQVLALECLISAYSMSALYLDGVSKAENQLVATGLLLMVFLKPQISNPKPLTLNPKSSTLNPEH